MYYFDKKDSKGTLLFYSGWKLANHISNKCFEKTEKNEVYKTLEKVFEKKYLKIFFKKLYYESVLPISHKITINKWEIENKKNFNPEKTNIKLFPVQKYLQDYLISENINFRSNFDFNIAKKKIFELMTKIKFFLKKKINKLFIRSKIIENSNESIGVCFSEGLNLDKRSDLFWLKNSKINPNDVILYFDYHSSVDKFEKKKDLFKIVNKLKIKTVNLWDWHAKAKVPFLDKLEIELKKIDISNEENKSMQQIALNLVNKVKFWYVFYKKLKIRILLDHYETGTENIAKQIALHKLDGCSIGKMRSHVGENTYDFLGFYPNDIFFVPSKDAGRRLRDHSFNEFEHIIISGFPYDLFTNNNKNEINKIKKNFSNKNKKFIILLLDSNHSKNKTSSNMQFSSTESINDFYNTFLNMVTEEKDIGLIIKTKKMHLIQELEDVYNKILDLEKNGSCYLVKDPLQRGPTLYASAANLVVAISTLYPSALIDCVSKKNLGVFLDYANLKPIEEKWYKWGENKVIFNDSKILEKKILEFKKDKSKYSHFGNWDDQKDILDSYQDNLGSERIGIYINFLLKGFRQRLSSSEAILSANNQFAENWGRDKILQ